MSATTAAFDWALHPRRLNLGCGWDKRPGYLNVDLHDFHEPDLVADVRDLSLLPSGQYEEIVAQDVLEHLSMTDGAAALAEWARLLAPGGRLHVRVPDLIGLFEVMRWSEDVEHQRNLVQCLFGTQAYDGDFHLNGYTEGLLRQALFDAGFDTVSVDGKDEWLFDAVAVRVDSPQPVDPAAFSRPNERLHAARRAAAAPPAAPMSAAAVPLAPPTAPAASPAPSSWVAELRARNVVSPPAPSSSRVPGGSLVHRLVARLVGRHLNHARADEVAYQASVVDALESLDRRVGQLEQRPH